MKNGKMAKGRPPFDPHDFTDTIAVARGKTADYIASHAPPTEDDVVKVMDTVEYMLQDISGWGNTLGVYDIVKAWIDALMLVYKAALVGGAVGDEGEED